MLELNKELELLSCAEAVGKANALWHMRLGKNKGEGCMAALQDKLST